MSHTTFQDVPLPLIAVRQRFQPINMSAWCRSYTSLTWYHFHTIQSNEKIIDTSLMISCRSTAAFLVSTMTCHLDWDSDHPPSPDCSILQPHNCRHAGFSSLSATNIWNSVPAHLTLAPLLTIFRQRVTTFPFQRSYSDLIIWHSEFTFCWSWWRSCESFTDITLL